MNVNLKLEELTELNQIRGLLSSSDFETYVLGFNAFKSSKIYRSVLQSCNYKIDKSGKQIPIYWFVNKVEDEIKKVVNNTQEITHQSWNIGYHRSIIQIIDSILLCESNRFTAPITFNIDKDEMMKKYSPEGILDRYIEPIVACEMPQTQLAF